MWVRIKISEPKQILLAGQQYEWVNSSHGRYCNKCSKTVGGVEGEDHMPALLLFTPTSDAMLQRKCMLLQNEIGVRFHEAPECSYCTAQCCSVTGH